MKYIGTLLRLKDDDLKQSLGRFYVHEGIEELFSCVSLELPGGGNARNTNRIPANTYIVKIRWSQKYKWHYHVTDVDGRSWILIHLGNYLTDIRGCILFGNDFVDINGDGHLDVTSSKKTMNRLLALGINEFELQIIDRDE